MQLQENTPGRWELVITDLTAKQHAARAHVEQLLTHKRDLALEAAMGGADARKKLEKANAELARLTLEGDDWDAAIAEAQRHLAHARDSEASEAERARQKELRTLAAVASRHAQEFSSSLRHAASAGAQLKLVVQNMLSRATPNERKNIDRLLEVGPYMRAAEDAGLRAHLEFPGYTGLKEHLMPLDAALAVHLGTWITTNGTED